MAERLNRKQSQLVTRAQIKKSAEGAFARRGVAGARIEEIVQAAGFTRGAFYANYRSKAELLVDLLEDRYVHELRLWNAMFEKADDPSETLSVVVAEGEDVEDALERSMISLELQIEAERNDQFRPYFMAHLDRIYTEIRQMFTTLLRRNGKAPPANLDEIVVLAYQLGLYLESPTVLGNDIGLRTTPGRMMMNLLSGMVAGAPPLESEN